MVLVLAKDVEIKSAEQRVSPTPLRRTKLWEKFPSDISDPDIPGKISNGRMI
jgi:hypothetical protein